LKFSKISFLLIRILKLLHQGTTITYAFSGKKGENKPQSHKTEFGLQNQYGRYISKIGFMLDFPKLLNLDISEDLP
jgi:hypothetical protein